MIFYYVSLVVGTILLLPLLLISCLIDIYKGPQDLNVNQNEEPNPALVANPANVGKRYLNENIKEFTYRRNNDEQAQDRQDPPEQEPVLVPATVPESVPEGNKF